MELSIILAIVWLHFFGDFILQSDRLARGKSKSNWILLEHATIYAIPFVIIGWQFAIINGMLHAATDWFTSRGTSYLWSKNEVHWFFVMIGLDQAIHFTTLFTTYQMLYK